MLQVYEAYYYQAPMAVKILTVDGPELDAATLQRFKEEVDLQRKLSLHPNIVRFLGACCPALQRGARPADMHVRSPLTPPNTGGRCPVQ